MACKIGLEIHVYPRMENGSKLFCSCPIAPEAQANTATCEVCTGQPGSKPMLPNREAFIKTLALARIFSATIPPRAAFQRKHYNWPDLPSGYQRTMSGSYSHPVAINGTFHGIGIQQIHLEEDPARWDPDTGTVDYNRSGTPLIEIVTHPDFTNPEQVREWLEKLRLRLDYAGCFDERFGIKADVNVSIAPSYIRTEVKNINSMSAIIEAIEHELKRQSSATELIQETRTWTGSETVHMRSKEDAQDYRFIPEQDLPAIPITPELLTEADTYASHDPETILASFIDAGMRAEDAMIITQIPLVASHAQTLMESLPAPYVGMFLRTEFLRVTNYAQTHPRMFTGSIVSIGRVATLLHEKSITEKTMREIMEALYDKDFDIDAHINEHTLRIVDDSAALEAFVSEAIEQNPSATNDYLSGKMEAINYLAGQVMRKSKGRADIRKIREMLEKKLHDLRKS